MISPVIFMMMMMMINFINVSRPHSLGKSHTNLAVQQQLAVKLSADIGLH